MISITAIGCCHGAYKQLKLEGGDLLIITGDLTARDEIWEYEVFVQWLNLQDYKKKIIIAGNHDMCLECEGAQLFKWAPNTEYLCNSGTEYEGLKIWGMPQSLLFEGINPKCTAFCVTEKEMKTYCDMIPEGIDILISHSPPFGILDGIELEDGSLFHTGSKSLRNAVLQGNRFKNLEFVVFSHIHEGYGVLETTLNKFVNCSIMNERYNPVNKIMRIKI